jgi:hypothetical protein
MSSIKSDYQELKSCFADWTAQAEAVLNARLERAGEPTARGEEISWHYDYQARYEGKGKDPQIAEFEIHARYGSQSGYFFTKDANAIPAFFELPTPLQLALRREIQGAQRDNIEYCASVSYTDELGDTREFLILEGMESKNGDTLFALAEVGSPYHPHYRKEFESPIWASITVNSFVRVHNVGLEKADILKAPCGANVVWRGNSFRKLTPEEINLRFDGKAFKDAPLEKPNPQPRRHLPEGARTVSLADIYDEDELRDIYDEEAEDTLYHWLEEDWPEQVFEVHVMQPEEFHELFSHDNRTKVLDAFEDLAEDWQRDLVASKTKNFDKDRVIVRSGKMLLDGYHHFCAAAKLGEPVLYIDLDHPIPAPALGGPNR